MCQFTNQCPVKHHRKPTACQYRAQSRTPSVASRPTSVRKRTPSLPPISSASVTRPPAATSSRSVQPAPTKNWTQPKKQPAPPPDPRQVHLKANRRKLIEAANDTAIEAGITYLFQPDGIYEVVADRLLSKTKMRRRFGPSRNHWLCIVLNNAAHMCETGTYIDLAAQGVEDGLRKAYGMPKVVARTLTQCAAVGAKLLLSPTVFGPANFPVVLRGLVALVCPNLERCPTQADVCTTLLGPLAADSLRTAAGGRGPLPS
jgi:hypothetical protein